MDLWNENKSERPAGRPAFGSLYSIEEVILHARDLRVFMVARLELTPETIMQLSSWTPEHRLNLTT